MSSLNVSFSVDALNLDPDSVFDPDQDLFHHHVFRGKVTRTSFTFHLSRLPRRSRIMVFNDSRTAGFDGFVVIYSRYFSMSLYNSCESLFMETPYNMLISKLSMIAYGLV
ncbi:hypothetical protein A2U01_0002906 [Trifolium medium]|uniref:Uncharacterized protein n=1 Tax=Trifolium medium TaxID=97028 RepID=A0A392M4A4_9FABA|nr:hypothetical protein [Trifolium medium]